MIKGIGGNQGKIKGALYFSGVVKMLERILMPIKGFLPIKKGKCIKI